ncbi:MAG: hypothetical protein LBT46_04190 [Planctomycetaceae bacterium]|jgi:DNA-directed RNA polymerase subunit RPC12/RpoP|nr:hypothetical protein [Planctomycetaceae bacterium]
MFRIVCLKCYQHIDVKAFQEGQVLTCPFCGVAAFSEEIPLPKEETTSNEESKVRILCPECGTKLFVPAHRIGKEEGCPAACKHPIFVRLCNLTESICSIVSLNIANFACQW